MEQIFSNTTLTVNQLIEKIDTGELGLPELQRPFIWKDSKVRDLFDSLMRGYPIGYLMLWECPSLEKKKSIGVDLHSYDSPKEVIIDGQRRLTSLYAVMKGKKVINSKFDEKSIIMPVSLPLIFWSSAKNTGLGVTAFAGQSSARSATHGIPSKPSATEMSRLLKR